LEMLKIGIVTITEPKVSDLLAMLRRIDE